MKKNILLITFLVLGFVLFRIYFNDSDKKEIRNILNEIQESIEFEKTPPPLSILTRLKTISSHLAPGFSVRAIESGDDQKEGIKLDLNQIKGAAVAGARRLRFLELFRLPSLIEVNRKNASAVFTITVTGNDPQNEQFKELFTVKMEFIKMDGKWLCSSLSADRLTPED